MMMFYKIIFGILLLIWNIPDFPCRSLHVEMHHEEVFAVRDIQKRDTVQRQVKQIDSNEDSLLLRISPASSRHKRSEPDEDLGENKSGEEKHEDDVRLLIEEYAVYVIVPTAFMFAMFIVFACSGGGSACCCCCCRPCLRDAAKKYVPGVRTDSKGNMYFDDLTEEEIQETKNLMGRFNVK